jgi:hypothetical protein
MENDNFIKVPIAVVLAFVNGRLGGADVDWVKRLYWVRRNIAGRYAHLKCKTPGDFPPNSYARLPTYYLKESIHQAERNESC